MCLCAMSPCVQVSVCTHIFAHECIHVCVFVHVCVRVYEVFGCRCVCGFAVVRDFGMQRSRGADLP